MTNSIYGVTLILDLPVFVFKATASMDPFGDLRQQPTNCLSVFDHFVGLALKGLTSVMKTQEKCGKLLLI